MDFKRGAKLHDLYGPVMSDLNGMGKRSTEWDVNDWRWDGDLFRAAPLNAVPSDCRSRQFFPIGSDIPLNNGGLSTFSSVSNEAVLADERERRDSEKRRLYVEVNEQENEEIGSLNLNLGGQVFPVAAERDNDNWEKSGKKTKVCSVPSNRAVCQVEDCKADLSNAKDYHRRHKVCDLHSKATRALVGSIMQRFCQQCSRFHVLQEFDEGKRSCRRRLAGHNKRRRKTLPDNVVGASALNDEQGSNYLLISLLRILSNVQSSNSDKTKDQDQDLLSHLLKNLASLAGSANDTNNRGSLPVSPELQNAGTSFGRAQKDTMSPPGQDATLPTSSLTQKSTVSDIAHGGATPNASTLRFSSPSTKQDATLGRAKLNKIDLNNVYDDSEDCMEDLLDNVAPENLGNMATCVSPWSSKDSQRSSPPQNSGNSGSSQSQSPSTSSGEAQSRTDRIVFKLFGKDPSDCPLVLRKQIFDWLSSSPTDIESYIRPGCIILTIYASMDKPSWDELYFNLNSSLRRLLDACTDPFWGSGWIYTRVRDHATFVYDGQVVPDTHMPLKIHRSCRISSIKPIAVSFSEAVHFTVMGFNLSRPTSRLLCALEGKYILEEDCADVAGADSFSEHQEFQCLNFSCPIPNTVGRGFIEVEDFSLSSSFFPFIVTEKDVCSEICALESTIEVTDFANLDTNKIEARNQALNFLHEMGWLLQKSRLILRLGESSDDSDLFPFKRFRYLIEFAMDHNWPAVVKKLLNILSDGAVHAGQDTSILSALLGIGLLHRAVRKNSRPMVELLLEYRPRGDLEKTRHGRNQGTTLFKPDANGPGGLNPLHIAAGLDGCDGIVDALTEDPESVGIVAWKNSRDSTGLTPHDYACLRGHYSYIHLVQRKLNKKSGTSQVVIDVPGPLLDDDIIKQKLANALANKTAKLATFQTERDLGLHHPHMMQCRKCEQILAYGSRRASVMIYRPAMISLVAIAAVCVCAALLFKSSPEVLYSFRPFRWETLKYGSE